MGSGESQLTIMEVLAKIKLDAVDSEYSKLPSILFFSDQVILNTWCLHTFLFLYITCSIFKMGIWVIILFHTQPSNLVIIIHTVMCVNLPLLSITNDVNETVGSVYEVTVPLWEWVHITPTIPGKSTNTEPKKLLNPEALPPDPYPFVLCLLWLVFFISGVIFCLCRLW